jgi:hypothetical protein
MTQYLERWRKKASRLWDPFYQIVGIDSLSGQMSRSVKAGSGGGRVWVWRIPYHVVLTNDDRKASERIVGNELKGRRMSKGDRYFS